MIKLTYHVVDSKDNDYIVKGVGSMGGEHDELLAEICAILDSFEERCPDLFTEALDIFLKTRGF